MCKLITDHNWQSIKQECGVLPRFLEYGSVHAEHQGIVPVGDSLDKLVPKDEWKERINEANRLKMFPIHYFEKANVVGKNQASTNFCWAYGISSCVEAVDLMQVQVYERLAPATLGWLVNWKNQGYWCSEAIKGAAKKGIASSKFARDGVSHYKYFEKDWESDCPNHKPLEWFDTIGTDSRRRNEEEQVAQCVSLLLTPSPLYIAYNWWSHALMMAGLIWDETQKYNLRWVAWNSHNDGRIELTGSRGVPDEAYAPRSTVHSVEVIGNV